MDAFGSILWALVLVTILAAAVALLVVKARSRRRGRDGFRYDVEGARVVDDGVLRRIWVIPVLFTNVSHRPAIAPTMQSTSAVLSDRRTSLTRRRYQYVGEFRWDDAVAPSGNAFNPGIAIPARVTIELPADELPRQLRVACLVQGRALPRINARVVPAPVVPEQPAAVPIDDN
jgi:hypothetical protein